MEEHGGLGDSVGRREGVQLYSSFGKHLVSDMGIEGRKYQILVFNCTPSYLIVNFEFWVGVLYKILQYNKY